MSLHFPSGPSALVGSFLNHRTLLWELVRRDFWGRYKGSVMGIGWSLFHPLLMLVVYTFVFSVAFKARWAGADDSKATFGMVLFSGMIVHGLFAECLHRAPSVIIGNPNYVKKVIFPIEILPSVAIISAVLHFFISFSLLCFFCIFSGVGLSVELLLVPVVMFPLVLIALGFAWLLAALGVYLRDIDQVVGIATTVLMFMSPVFYPTNSLPNDFQKLLALNPTTFPINQLRAVVLWHEAIRWNEWIVSFICGALIAWFGFWFFQKTRKGFSDVL